MCKPPSPSKTEAVFVRRVDELTSLERARTLAPLGPLTQHEQDAAACKIRSAIDGAFRLRFRERFPARIRGQLEILGKALKTGVQENAAGLLPETQVYLRLDPDVAGDEWARLDRADKLRRTTEALDAIVRDIKDSGSRGGQPADPRILDAVNCLGCVFLEFTGRHPTHTERDGVPDSTFDRFVMEALRAFWPEQEIHWIAVRNACRAETHVKLLA